VATGQWASYKPEIAEFIVQDRTVRFANDDIETDVDHVLFCTGYHYSFPFLQGLTPGVFTDGPNEPNLYQHLVYIPDPTLAFPGIPQRVVPFPLAEAQAAFLARLWARRLPWPPSARALEEWERYVADASQSNTSLHSLKFPKDFNYINKLHAMSLEAEKRPGLDCEGSGKPPVYWDEEKAWIRERFPKIKEAARNLGEERSKITDLKQLNFEFV
jgi:hypothetical protein